MKQDLLAQKTELIAILVKKGIRNKRLLDAIFDVPRELFVPEQMSNLAYKNKELAITEDLILPSPHIMSLMLEAAEISIYQKVLEIGTGSGYVTAILSRLCKDVYSVEENESLAAATSWKLDRMGYKNVTVCFSRARSIIKRGIRTVICNNVINDYSRLVKIIKPETVLIVQTGEGIVRKILKIEKNQNGKVFKNTVAQIAIEKIACYVM